MRRGFILITLSVLLICLLAGTQSAAAQLLAGVQLSYGWANYADILGKPSARASQLLTSVWGQYDHEDLRFTGSYLGSLSLGGKSVSQNLGQLAANYRLLEEGPMQIYVGLGYHLLSTRFDGELGGQSGDFTLTGHGFAGQVVLDIELAPKVRSSAVLTATPWVNWSYTSAKKTTADILASTSFNARLDVTYDFSEELSIQVGLVGGSFKVPGFKHEGLEFGPTREAFTGISAGITQRF
ncbi:MAG: hypothetical protein WBI73_10380 [Limnochordia bacterium]